jgi:SPOR domain
MRDLYSDEAASVAGQETDRLIPEGVRRLAGAAVFVALVAGMGLWAYRLGTRDAAEVPIIRAMEGPSRVQPEDPGGLQAAHQGLEVNTVLAGVPAPAPRLAEPAAPTPGLDVEDGPQGELVLATPAALPEEAATGTGDDLRMPPQEDGPSGVEPAPDFGGTALVAPEEQPEEATEAAEQALPPVVPSPRPKVRPANLVVARRTAPAATVAAASAAAPAAAPTPAAAAPAAAAPASREVSRVQAGSRMVQLGAFDSEAITREAWAKLVARHGDLLAGKSLYAERATSNARVFYRLRVAGFDNAEQTRVMCASLRARGVDCIPVTLQ